MRRILLVEDDSSLGATLKERLTQIYLVTWCQSKAAAQSELVNTLFDLIILDVGLPDGSGFDIAKDLKQRKIKSPIIFLTAQSDAESRLKGYELGAEEYIPKPFHLKELLLRVEHVMDSHTPAPVLLLPQCEVNFTEMKIKRRSGEIEFPALKDLKVLQFLVEKSPEAVSRDQILDEVWGPEKEINHRTVDNTIVRLKKLLSDENDQLIRSVRGVGYQWIYQVKGNTHG